MKEGIRDRLKQIERRKPMIKYLQKRTLNLIYWTFTIIFLCALAMTKFEFEQLFAWYLLATGSMWVGFDKRFNKHFE